jgi:hypothetical protein
MKPGLWRWNNSGCLLEMSSGSVRVLVLCVFRFHELRTDAIHANRSVKNPHRCTEQEMREEEDDRRLRRQARSEETKMRILANPHLFADDTEERQDCDGYEDGVKEADEDSVPGSCSLEDVFEKESVKPTPYSTHHEVEEKSDRPVVLAVHRISQQAADINLKTKRRRAHHVKDVDKHHQDERAENPDDKRPLPGDRLRVLYIFTLNFRHLTYEAMQAKDRRWSACCNSSSHALHQLA